MSITFLTLRLKDALGDAFQRRIGRDDDGTIAPVNLEHPDQRAALLLRLEPLLGVVGLAPSAKAAVIAQLNAPGPSSVFTPIAGRAMNLVCSGGGNVAAQLERSFDNGGTWYVKITDALRALTPETFVDTETEVGVQYRWNVTAIGSGTVTVRISQ